MNRNKLDESSKYVVLILLVTLLNACIIVDVDADREAKKYDKADASTFENATSSKPKNIIMVVADGMGPAFVSAYRYYNDNPDTAYIETTIFDDILVGSAQTYPHPQSGLITDSAASATALATGVKSYNTAIGVDVNKQALETVLHRAHKLGKNTGIAVTSHIAHATPASYLVANESRHNYQQIADSMYDDRINGEHLADIMLGAGWGYFIREDRNLVEAFKRDGYQYIDNYTGLNDLDKSKPALGLFGDNSVPWALDDTDPLRLSTMTQAAVPFLESEDGFFLLVEASMVDWAGHANDIASAMAEMHDLAKTMEYLYQYVQENPDTLVVLTADHSTGGLSIGANGDYKWEPSYLHNMRVSTQKMATDILSEEDRVAYVEGAFGFTLTDEEKASLDQITADMKERPRAAVLKKIVDDRTNTGWTTSGHTGLDVQVFAFGPGANVFVGSQNNTQIAHKLFALLEEAND
ncbi:alkaline phosphatase [Glaciecola petra]|uniref:Alkaline phosphatase n=1 Tax=Glaciecola petra TaxID=3075602 RepID=A0ABU2ZTC9_9ALTE|nr:alkaline phosphatase [Aestuariibacter sp. P117]MDT0595905.1 alkaline phosphatase [Aestuariibacter sp. P117]